MDHFDRPRHTGEIEAPDAVASGQNPVCGDEVRATFRIEGARIREARYRAVGCHATIAVMSVLSGWVRGRSVTEARALTPEDVIDWFDSFPRGKHHAAELAIEVLQQVRGNG